MELSEIEDIDQSFNIRSKNEGKYVVLMIISIFGLIFAVFGVIIALIVGNYRVLALITVSALIYSTRTNIKKYKENITNTREYTMHVIANSILHLNKLLKSNYPTNEKKLIQGNLKSLKTYIKTNFFLYHSHGFPSEKLLVGFYSKLNEVIKFHWIPSLKSNGKGTKEKINTIRKHFDKLIDFVKEGDLGKGKSLLDKNYKRPTKKPVTKYLEISKDSQLNLLIIRILITVVLTSVFWILIQIPKINIGLQVFLTLVFTLTAERIVDYLMGTYKGQIKETKKSDK